MILSPPFLVGNNKRRGHTHDPADQSKIANKKRKRFDQDSSMSFWTFTTDEERREERKGGSFHLWNQETPGLETGGEAVVGVEEDEKRRTFWCFIAL